MNQSDARTRVLAVSLSALAGYVDAIGFIASGGYFVSFMSGNTTRMSVGLTHTSADAAVAAGLVATFLSGVVAGSVTGHFTKRQKRFVVLILVATLLALAAASSGLGQNRLSIFLLAFTMGAENSVLERNGEVGLGLTYMTGSLVRIGHGIAGRLIGQNRRGWTPYAVLWLGLTSGAVAGASAYSHAPDYAIWIASGWAFLLALTARTKHRAPVTI